MKKIKKRSKFQKCPQSFPSVQTCLGTILLEKFFCSVFNGLIGIFRKNQKNSKLQKCPRSYRKMCKLLLNMFCGNFLEKKNAPCSMEGRAFEKILKKSKIFENSKKAQNIPKSVQTCFEHVLGQFLPTNFCPVFHGGPGFRKNFKKIKNFWKFQKSPKHSQKCANMFWTCFGAISSHKLLPSVPWRAGFSRIFKKMEKIQSFKSVHTCFELALGDVFENFLPSVPCSAFQIFWT